MRTYSKTWILELVNRSIQWISTAIVLGLTSYLLRHGHRGLSLTYQEVIAVVSIVFFLPALLSPFLPVAVDKFVLGIDVIFSYLWLTSFIFAALDYSQGDCFLNSPPNLGCSRKKANEAFIFLAFITTFFGIFLEVADIWIYRKEHPRRVDDGSHPDTSQFGEGHLSTFRAE
ncbi:hypothetical protein N7474_003258 [Penicillium riverlandense]|uniref:uncharacterized protein n=1 Tax=Penicillium riverlandense TaxID=1903569 RepID=UPI0025486515|nr:uncharacterized protein N7474_003258 [Penicillium riverlandense]KAJ5826120.1 hypothetical protein N7474_003258 [Penicillium riverlandense]